MEGTNGNCHTRNNQIMRKKIVYCTPSLYIPGGVERVLTTKANYLAEVAGYHITIVLTDGKGKEPYYPLSPKVKIIQLDINFEELWHLSFIKKVFVYLKKQRIFKKKLTDALMELRPDITVSLLRREINFLTSIKDGSKKVGEIHVNKANYRNFESNNTNIIKDYFAKWWMNMLIKKVKKLDRFVVLTHEDKEKWHEIGRTEVIPNPIPHLSPTIGNLENKQVIAVGRYAYQKGFDLLIEAWKLVIEKHPDWTLNIYGSGERKAFQEQIIRLGIEKNCILNGPTSNINEKYAESSILAFSSRFEGFGMVLLEAMNCGIPCVSFACPCGPKDIITDGKNGYLVEPNNIEALAERICYLIENEEVRKEMGKAARKRAEDFTEEKIMKQWVDLFENIS